MNTRIKELWNEAGGTFTSGNQHDWPYARIDNPEKFAELLLSRVMSICEDLGDQGMDGHYCVDHIRREFGL
jgi:hypothetical protein